MKIENGIKSVSGADIKETKARPANAAANAPSSASAAREDKVQINSLVSQLMAGGDTEVVNTARVEAIKQAISEGRFKINPEAIADGLIATAKELAQQGQKTSRTS